MSNNSQSSDGGEDDLTPLQYARTNGLSFDYLAEPLPFEHIEKLQTDVHADLSIASHLPQFDFGPELSTDERLTISRDTALLLASVTKEETVEWVDSLVLSMLGSTETKRIRLEEPLLKTNHEKDCREFAKREGFEVKLKDVKLPLEIVNEENGEGLGLPSKFWTLGEEIMDNLRKEKIAVTRDTLEYLHNTLKITWTEQEEKEVWNSELKYKRNTALEPVTPPLSPIFYPTDPYEPSPSSPGMQLPILSDPPSLTKEDLQAVENHIFNNDVPTPLRRSNQQDNSSDTYADSETFKLGDIYSPLASLENTLISPFIETHLFKREDLKVEEPLTPPMPVPQPQKSVHFSDIIEEMLLDHPSSPQPDILENSFFNEAFGDAGERANGQLEQEKLLEADSTARVDVPVMDFFLPNPPWKGLQEHLGNPATLLAMQKTLIKNLVGTETSRWLGVAQLNHQLRLTPFPHGLTKIALDENLIPNDATWKVFVQGPDDTEVVDSSSLTWKPPGLRILGDDDDDDELEPGKFKLDNPLDISFLVKKRKMELEDDENARLRLANKEPSGSMVACDASLLAKEQSRKKTFKPSDFISAAQKLQMEQTREQGLGSLLSGTFSTGNLLQNYLELRGCKKPKLMESSYFAPKNGQPDVPAQAAQNELHQHPTMELPIGKSPIATVDPLPIPNICTPTSPVSIIVASTLLKHRALIKHLEAQIPSVRIIERDFTAHNTTVWLPGSVTRSPIASPLASEADLAVSPSTGIIITTLQKVKQKPLPGRKAMPEIRDRLEKVSLRYERLVVLVSEGRSDETTDGLDDKDSLALCEFIGYTIGLEASVTVQFVGGGEETLSKWLVSTIIQNGPLREPNLLEEETHWELFLRRAGMNAFAAQEVIAAIKAPDGVDPSSPTKSGQFGLTAFVDMGREQRIARFGDLCGKKVLERVSTVVDMRWE